MQRGELSREVGKQQKRLAAGTPVLTSEKIKALGILLRNTPFDGPPELRQVSASLLLSEVAVTREEIRIAESKYILARCASTELGNAAPAGVSAVQEWQRIELVKYL